MLKQRAVPRPDREVESVGPLTVKEAGVLGRETKFPRSDPRPTWTVGGRVHAASRRRRWSRAIAKVKTTAVVPAFKRRVSRSMVGGRSAADGPAENRDAVL